MTAAAPQPETAPAAGDKPRPERMNFRSSRSRVKMDPAQGRRQGDIVALALRVLGGKDAALAFLNTEDAELAARPLDRAMASEDGYAAVAARIAALA